jgi:hypothetical protein
MTLGKSRYASQYFRVEIVSSQVRLAGLVSHADRFRSAAGFCFLLLDKKLTARAMDY